MRKQYLDSLRRKDSLRGAETAGISVRLEYYSASHFEGSAYPVTRPRHTVERISSMRKENTKLRSEEVRGLRF
jgi:hypothetical protein